jgi:drug/metabolite transporter (DMT)-like permease
LRTARDGGILWQSIGKVKAGKAVGWTAGVGRRTAAKGSETQVEKTQLAVLVTVGLCAVSVAGDYCLKRASIDPVPFSTYWFLAGFVLYSSTTFGAIYVMRYLSFATLGVVYSAATILLLTLVGIVFLHESLRWQEVLGVVLALAAIGLLARFA